MRRPILIILAIVLALGAVEGIAYWWMHPAPAGLGEPVLAYRPGVNAEKLKTETLKEEAPAPTPGTAHRSSSSSNQQSTINNPQSEIRRQESEVRDQRSADAAAHPSSTDQRSPITDPSSPPDHSTYPPHADGDKWARHGGHALPVPTDHSPSFTLLPELVTRSMHSLRCSSGIAARIDRDNGATVHLAFFEWNLADSTNVLEAYRHLPEECMGSIGMTLVKKHPPRKYVVRGQKSEIRSQRSEVRSQKSEIRKKPPRKALPLQFQRFSISAFQLLPHRSPSTTPSSAIPPARPSMPSRASGFPGPAACSAMGSAAVPNNGGNSAGAPLSSASAPPTPASPKVPFAASPIPTARGKSSSSPCSAT